MVWSKCCYKTCTFDVLAAHALSPNAPLYQQRGKVWTELMVPPIVSTDGVVSTCCTISLALPAELRTSLEEHQSAIELIMTKYREQVFRLLMASKRDDPAIVTQLKEQHTTVSHPVSIQSFEAFVKTTFQ